MCLEMFHPSTGLFGAQPILTLRLREHNRRPADTGHRERYLVFARSLIVTLLYPQWQGLQEQASLEIPAYEKVLKYLLVDDACTP